VRARLGQARKMLSCANKTRPLYTQDFVPRKVTYGLMYALHLRQRDMTWSLVSSPAARAGSNPGQMSYLVVDDGDRRLIFVKGRVRLHDQRERQLRLLQEAVGGRYACERRADVRHGAVGVR
jgi:hypothetical protein